jgi:hypothetical protein
MSVSTLSASPDRADASSSATPTFARRRLRLGISGVGASVILSLILLVALLWQPQRVLDLDLVTSVSSFATTLAWPAPFTLVPLAVPIGVGVYVLHLLLLVAVEFRGGAIVVRSRPSVRTWIGRWARGVFVQGVLLALLLTLAAVAASFGVARGWPSLALAGGVLLGSTLLLAWQGVIARAFASVQVQPADASIAALAEAQGIAGDAVRIVTTDDEAFVGGWIGVRRPVLWVPASWTHEAHRELLTVQFARRQVQFASGARRRGLLRAAMWPALGVLLFTPLLPFDATSAAFWLALPAISTLWMFVGVLVLPSFSRPVVYSADAVAAARIGRAPVQRALPQLDAWQDDEPERTPGVEFIFHPVPSRGNRERALSRAARRTLGGAHQLTRLSLFASLAGGSLLGRVVHCNIGRPALWAVYPGD